MTGGVAVASSSSSSQRWLAGDMAAISKWSPSITAAGGSSTAHGARVRRDQRRDTLSIWRTGRPRLLYISPAIPRDTGNGLAMRAASVLHALTRHCDIWLLVVRLYDDPWGDHVPDSIGAL